MATVTCAISGSIYRENGGSRAQTLSWSLPSALNGATVNSVKIQMTLSITARTSGYARVQNSSDAGIEYLREYRSGTYTTSTVSTSKISSITLTFRADTTVYVTFDNLKAIIDYTPGFDVSTINSPTADAGSDLNFTITNNKLSQLKHTLKLTFGTESATVNVAQGVGTASYTIPMTWLQQMTDKATAYGSVVCETYNGSTKIGSKSASFGVTAPSSAAPTITLTLLQTGSAIPAGWGMYLQTFSGVDLIASVQTVQLATMSTLTFSHGERDSQNQYVSHVSVLNTAGEITLTATVRDSRGLEATATQTITVVPYSSPTFEATSLQRCDSSGHTTDASGNPLETGTYVLAQADVLYSSCNTHNQLAIAIDVDVDDVWVPVDSLSDNVPKVCSAPPTTDFPDGFDPGTIYKFRIRAVDSLNVAAEKIIYLQSVNMIMHVRDDETGIAFGMVSRRAGFEFRPDWDVYFYGEELLGMIIPIGIVIQLDSSKDPEQIYPNTTWTALSTTGGVTTWQRAT